MPQYVHIEVLAWRVCGGAAEAGACQPHGPRHVAAAPGSTGTLEADQVCCRQSFWCF